MSPPGPACGAVLPNPSNRGDTHTHDCALGWEHDVPHRCACGTQWSHNLRADGASATLIRFPTSGPGAPDIDLRRTGRGFGACVVCDEPISDGRRFEEYGRAAYHWDCRDGFALARAAAANILQALRAAPGPAEQELYLIRTLSWSARGGSDG